MIGGVISLGGQIKVSKSCAGRITIKKSYFFISSSSGPSKLFMKHAFELLALNDVPTVLIHYVRNEKCAVPYAHGNATSDSKRKYIRTCHQLFKVSNIAAPWKQL